MITATLLALTATIATPAGRAATPPLAQTGAFIENKGQWDAQAQFLARSAGVDVWVTQEGITYDLWNLRNSGNLGNWGNSPNSLSSPNSLKSRRGHVLRMEFAGGSLANTQGQNQLEGVHNYLKGKNPKNWTTGVARYESIRSERVYPGIDAVWYFDKDRPRYDLVVAPGADPNQIALSFEGANSLKANGKTLTIGTSLGDLELRGLFAYQRINGGIKQIPCEFKQSGKEIRFQTGAYDKANPLVIDPILWSTFIGGSSTDSIAAVRLDSNGKPVAAGSTYSTDLPTTAGAYDTTDNTNGDVFVAKLSSDGTTLAFMTYLGGTAMDAPGGIALNADNSIVIVGNTYSTDFPATAGAFDTVANGSQDAFVAKLSANGSTLAYATYLGGDQSDTALAVALDSTSNPVVIGNTSSTGFPTTAGAYDASYNNNGDGYVTKLALDGSSLIASSFAGTSSVDQLGGVVLDPSDNVYTVGTVVSGFTSTIAPDLAGVATGILVFKFNPELTTLPLSSVLGGPSAFNTGVAIALDSSLNPIIAGATNSSSFPGTTGGYSSTVKGGAEGFIAQLQASDLQIARATLFGGTGDEQPLSLARDSAGNLLVVGNTASSDYPTTSGGIDRSINSAQDCFLSKFDPTLSKLYYSTFLGGTGTETLGSIAVDASRNSLLGGGTSSSEFPVTSGAFDTTFDGGQDAFLTRLLTAPTLTSASVPKSTFVGGFSVPLDLGLNQVAEPGDVLVALGTTVPSKVLIPANTKMKKGKQTKGLGIRTETVKVNTPVQVTASLNGVTKTMSFTLLPGGLLSVKVSQSTITPGTLRTGTVYLSAPAPQGGRKVGLESSRPDILFVPTEVGVTQGYDNAIFPIYAGAASASTPVTITAMLGTMKKTVSITVVP